VARLLGHLGFPDGASVGGLGVSPEAMQAMQAARASWSRTAWISGSACNVVFAQEGLQVTRTRPGRGRTKHTMYCITANIP
jgi:hypothetical protein